MEYRTPFLAFLGIATLVLWSLSYWHVFRSDELHLPMKGERSKIHRVIRIAFFMCGVVGWLFISYALMQPRRALSFAPSSIEVNDIHLVIDVSRSMLADDLQPNRLEVAKKKLREFAAMRPKDRIGVIIFSEKVFTLLPLTTDSTLINKIMDEISIGYLGSGTNIGDALGLAVARAQSSETKNKVIVLLTDGVNNVGNLTPLQAAEQAKNFNIKIYTIGLGTDKDARIPVGTRYQRIPGGSIDVETLDKISNLTGGKRYLANSEKSLENILEEIEKLERTEIKSQNQVVYEELYFQFLLIGFCFYMASELARLYILREVA